MNLDDYRTIFTATTLVLMLIATSPTLAMIVHVPKASEPFSELWVLSPNHTLEDYPYNITLSEQATFFVGVANHLGRSAYYMVYVKLRNQSQPLPDANTTTPSPVSPLYEFHLFLQDGEMWENSVSFAILNATRANNTAILERVSINDVFFEGNYTADLDAQKHGFFYQLFFELWLYDTSLRTFQYHNRFGSAWMRLEK